MNNMKFYDIPKVGIENCWYEQMFNPKDMAKRAVDCIKNIATIFNNDAKGTAQMTFSIKEDSFIMMIEDHQSGNKFEFEFELWTTVGQMSFTVTQAMLTGKAS